MPYHLITGVVPDLDANEFLPKLAKLGKENFHALMELQTKCMFPKYEFSILQDSKKILNKFGLLHEDGQVKDVVRKIVIDRIESESTINILFYRMVALIQRGDNFLHEVFRTLKGEEIVAAELEEYADQVLKQKIQYAISHGKLNHIDDLLDLSKCPDVLKNDPLANKIGLTFNSQMGGKIPIAIEKIASMGMDNNPVTNPRSGASLISNLVSDSFPESVRMPSAPPIPTAIPKELAAAVEPTVESKELINATLTAKTLDYLANNKYKILFAIALISLVIYDRNHKNHVGKVAGAVKNGLLSLWKKAITPSTQQKTDPDKNQEQAIDFPFAGPGL